MINGLVGGSRIIGSHGYRDGKRSLADDSFAAGDGQFDGLVGAFRGLTPTASPQPSIGGGDSAQSYQRVGGEIAVAQNNGGSQYHSNSGQTVTLANGNFLIVWADFISPPSNNNDVRARIFSADGTPVSNDIFVHASNANTQGGARVAALPDGGFAIGWYDEGPSGLNGTQTDGIDGSLSGVVARVFSATGNPVSGEIVVNTATLDNQNFGYITALSNDNFVVSWADNSQGVGGASGDNSSFAVKAQIFSGAGVKIGAEFLVNEATSGIQGGGPIVALANGSFAVFWDDFSAGVGGATGDNSGAAVKGRLFAADGTALGGEFLVNSATAGDQQFGVVAKLAGGGFVVAWQDSSLGVGGATGDASGTAAKAQILNASGNKVGGEILINSAVSGDQLIGNVIGLAGGNFVAVWSDLSLGVGGAGGDTSSYAQKAQVFAADGTRIGGEILVNTATAGAQLNGRIAATTDGGFVITWSDASAGVGGATGDNSGRAVKAQAFAADGARIGDEILVNTTTNGNQTSPQIAALANGGFAINWDDGSGSFPSDIKAQVFARPSIAGTSGDDVLVGTAGDDVIQGLAGNDYLDGGAGADRLEGGEGNDIYILDNVRDVVVESAGGGLDTIFTSASTTLGADVERLGVNGFSTTYAISLYGNGLANEMWGNDGTNIIDGGAGVDIMYGFGGNDVFFVDNADDQIIELAGQGLDTVFTSFSFVLNHDLERLGVNGFTTTFAINLTGNELANEMWGNDGANIIDGGAGADLIYGYGGNDIYIVDNRGDLIIESAGGGLDTIFTSTDFTLEHDIERLGVNGFYTTYSINLYGNELANEMWGNEGASFLDGKAGNDIIYGFGGADLFAFTTALGPNNVDQLIDFTAGTDRIAIDDAVFAGLAEGQLAAGAFRSGSGAQDADDRIIYDPTTGALYFDADGNGSGAQIQFANLNNNLSLSAVDFQVI